MLLWMFPSEKCWAFLAGWHKKIKDFCPLKMKRSKQIRPRSLIFWKKSSLFQLDNFKSWHTLPPTIMVSVKNGCIFNRVRYLSICCHFPLWGEEYINTSCFNFPVWSEKTPRQVACTPRAYELVDGRLCLPFGAGNTTWAVIPNLTFHWILVASLVIIISAYSNPY